MGGFTQYNREKGVTEQPEGQFLTGALVGCRILTGLATPFCGC